MKNIFCSLLMVGGLLISGAAFADHGHGHGHGGIGFYFGWPYPFYASPYYPYPYYPPVVAVPSQPPVYVEQGNAQPAPQQAPTAQAGNYWYHCDKPEGYYPYIKECPGGWKAVSSTPPQK